LALVPEDHSSEVVERCRELLERFDESRAIRDLAPATRKLLHGGVLYALASLDAFRASSNVLEYADRLEGLGLKLYEMVADQLRTNYHALRGEAELADRYRGRVELHAVQAGSAWQAEIWAPCTMIAVNVLTQDTIGLKRTIEQLDRLGQEIPSLAFHAGMARSEYHFLKGEHAQGVAISGPLRASMPERGFTGYTFSLASEAHALNRLGRHAEAKALMEPWVQRLSDADKAMVGHYGNLARELAHAYCGLGDRERAFAIIDELLERHGGSGHPLLLGNLHSTGAAIAIAAGDTTRALEHLTQMEHAFRPTKNPALIAQWEHMRREVRRMVEQRTPELAASLDVLDSSSGAADVPVRSLLNQCKSAEQRAQLALDLIVDHVRGKRGFLFALQHAELQLIAPRHGAEPQTELVERIRHDIDQEDVTVVGRPARSPLPPALEAQPSRTAYRTITLAIPVGGALRVVGAVAIEGGARLLAAPQTSFLQTVARALFDDGDTGETKAGTR
jgi:tetratricopeptide (TPR) repeat protein